MRSAEDLLKIEFNKKEYQMADYPFGDTKEAILSAIKTAQSEAIKEAAKDAERYINGMPEPIGSEVSESILQLLNQIK